ncbi:MAG: hypothetical protein H0W83_04535 [Planctomycetes bacterium]|nr:hypothetical protein [Planctomycetota bacterium]
MKTLLAVPAVLLFSIALVSCGTGQERSAATTKASSSVPADVAKSTKDLDQVQAGLKNLQNAGDNPDLKKMYGDLKSEANHLVGSLEDVRSHSDSAIAAGRKQIEQWHKDADGFTDPDLRTSSNKREGDLRAAVDALAASSATLTTASDSYRSSLSQTLKALDLDLSKPGLESVQPVVAKLVNDEPNLRTSLKDVSEKSQSLNGVINP